MTDITGTQPASGPECERAARPFAESDLPLSALRPLMEGARARGVADACELLGLGAVLLDRSGGVLHLSSCASALMGGALRLVGGHLVAADSAANQVVERLVGAALSGSPSEDVIAGKGAASVRMRALPMPGARGDDAQLLKAVLFITEIEDCAAIRRAGAQETARAA